MSIDTEDRMEYRDSNRMEYRDSDGMRYRDSDGMGFKEIHKIICRKVVLRAEL